MQIFVNAPKGNVLTVDVEGSHTVQDLRQKVHAAAQLRGVDGGFPPSRQRLFFTDPLGGVQELQDGVPLAEYGIKLESRLNLGLRPPPLPVDLNVGGVPFTTLLSTLTSVRGSRLCELFQGLLQAAPVPEAVPGCGLVDLPVDAQGAFVLDRDGPSFRFILNYLRDKAGTGAGAPGLEAETEPGVAVGELPAHLAELRDELAALKLTALKSRAAATGVEPGALWAAHDADDIKQAVIELILKTVSPPEVDLPSALEELQRLEREADFFGIVELGAACRQKIKREHQTSLMDQQVLRSLLAEQCAVHMTDEQRAAAVAEVERLCDGAFSVRGLREVHQRMADRTTMQDLVARGHAIAEARASGVNPLAAQSMMCDWTGRYNSVGAMACVTDAEVDRLGLARRDADAARAVAQRFDFEGVDNSDKNKGTWDKRGVLYYIGTEGNRPGASGKTPEWINPHDCGRVVVTMSSSNTGSAGGFVSAPDMPSACGTRSQAKSWIAVDLGEKRRVAVTHYALRTYSSSHQPKNWELQGAATADGPWTPLSRHDQDTTFTGSGSHEVGAWPVHDAAPHRVFRIYQHGQNNSSSSHLYTAGIELWGELAYLG